ncbi:TadE/TadG family type IV pilus assembly protein [Gilliamella sp. ESL0250]|uniref:TadE/TadG family type IV pilus assembly protein n=1 Tax=Gilliamella sp. ESL0250 TaxID=2705036 RepID=UPI0015810DF9|nr:TadE family protein [Gilliamella sp. ESL0250]NUF48519.1 pilus assembly protein [Gilliamella sp. ESL0250]
MLKYWKLLFRQKRASVSIEAAIVVPYLGVLFLFVLEFSRIMAIGSSLDLMVTEITKKTSLYEYNDYDEVVNHFALLEVPMWPYLTNGEELDITLTYCETIEEAIENKCQDALSDNTHILVFDLEYHYYAIFSELFSRIIDSSLKKKTIVYREFYPIEHRETD